MKQLMNTINGTYERCQMENIGISKNLIRSLVKSGTIPYVRVGSNQVLINFEVLINYLVTGSVDLNETTTANEIRPVPEDVRRIK